MLRGPILLQLAQQHNADTNAGLSARPRHCQTTDRDAKMRRLPSGLVGQVPTRGANAVTNPTLFCFDGSPGSQRALKGAGDLLARPTQALVLTVWEPLVARLTFVESFAPIYFSDEPAQDEQEAAHAREVAQRGAELATEHGYEATALVEIARAGVAHAILEVADRHDVALIVCGRRGRGAVRTAVLGSVSHAILMRSHRTVLIAPESQEPNEVA
jgi:nucleotide-binding universal stress UspA family protein